LIVPEKKNVPQVPQVLTIDGCILQGDGCNGGSMGMAAVYYQNSGFSTTNDPTDIYSSNGLLPAIAYNQQQAVCRKAGGDYKAACYDIPATTTGTSSSP
jgi:hypothetical protein